MVCFTTIFFFFKERINRTEEDWHSPKISRTDFSKMAFNLLVTES